jgi:DNA-binding NarL/FixJ family response regulator
MEIKKTIRVILADDHLLLRRGIRKLLEKSSNILVVGEAGTGATALHLVQELLPDVLLLDIEMPDMNGTQVVQELRKKHAPVSIVILSACDDPHFIEETRRMGVNAYLTKSESPARIRETIQQAATKYAAIAPLLVFLMSKAGPVLFQAINSLSLAVS